METTTPTVYLVLGGSAVTRDARGEIIETVDVFVDGTPDWSCGGICDHRGEGGPGGFALLDIALRAAEANARLIGFDIARIGGDA
jgi:hypothetical protein